ncbi:MAG: threonylcarbamoyl-AMP synthase [Nitrospirae bacterium]|nr:threonylcarbamoyl-AMP synthase [Nitrospirota bacterium]
MLILSITEKNSDSILKKSSEILKSSGIIAYPTESFYALGVLATDEAAVRKLYDLKKRPADKPLPIIVGDINSISAIVKNIPLQAGALMKRFWPGPLTLIFDAKETVPSLLTGGKGKVAVRIPGDSVALHLARALQLPITSTSANPSGAPPAEDTEAILKYFGDKIDLIIDAGKAPGGKPSTIIDVTVTPPKVLREGSIVL